MVLNITFFPSNQSVPNVLTSLVPTFFLSPFFGYVQACAYNLLYIRPPTNIDCL